MPESVFPLCNHHHSLGLVGALDSHLRHIQNRLSVVIANQGNQIVLRGRDSGLAERCLTLLNQWVMMGKIVDLSTIDDAIYQVQGDEENRVVAPVIVTHGRRVRCRTSNQAVLVDAIMAYSLVFATGPAGTGKTYLAVAAGVESLLLGNINRLILCRPAVEAGERLGFLPGDMRDKIDPFMRPLFDALHDFMTPEQVNRRIERGDIEIIPLAYMRGRTLDHAFIIVDEAQNASVVQMKMVLTRLGRDSRMVVTGDPSQVDRIIMVDKHQSGLQDSIDKLSHVDDISVVRFQASDSVRHPLVKKILEAYHGVYHEDTQGQMSML